LPRDVAQAHLNLGMIAYIREQSELALAHLEESVSLAREGGLPPQLSLALTFLGRARLWVYGPFDDATLALLEEGLAVAQKAESHYSTGHALVTLGDLLWGRHDTDGASRLWREALIVRSELTDRRGIAGCLERLAKARAAHQQFEVAAWLFGAADAQHRALGIRLRHDEATDHERLVAHTRQILGDAFEPEWSAGFSAGWEYAVQRALSDIAS
jgi:tetratricopeptide (TPR) repeat protein